MQTRHDCTHRVLHPTRLPLLRADEVFLEAKEIAFEERDISTDLEARREMTEEHGSAKRRRWSFLAGDIAKSLSV